MVSETGSAAGVAAVLSGWVNALVLQLIKSITEESGQSINLGYYSQRLWTTTIFESTYRISFHTPETLIILGNPYKDGPPWNILANRLRKALEEQTIADRQVVVVDPGGPQERRSPLTELRKNPGKVVFILHGEIINGEHTEIPLYEVLITAYWGGQVL